MKLKNLFSKSPDAKTEILKAIDKLLDPKLRFDPNVGVPEEAILQIATACGFKIAQAEQDEAERIADEYDAGIAVINAHDHHRALAAHKARQGNYGQALSAGDVPVPSEIRGVVSEFSAIRTATRAALAAGPCRQAGELFLKLADRFLEQAPAEVQRMQLAEFEQSAKFGIAYQPSQIVLVVRAVEKKLRFERTKTAARIQSADVLISPRALLSMFGLFPLPVQAEPVIVPRVPAGDERPPGPPPLTAAEQGEAQKIAFEAKEKRKRELAAKGELVLGKTE